MRSRAIVVGGVALTPAAGAFALALTSRPVVVTTTVPSAVTPAQRATAKRATASPTMYAQPNWFVT